MLQPQTIKYGKDIGRRSVNLRILFNGAEEYRNELNNQLQEQFRTNDKNDQVRFSKLQSTANPKLVGRLVYDVPIIEITRLEKKMFYKSLRRKTTSIYNQ